MSARPRRTQTVIFARFDRSIAGLRGERERGGGGGGKGKGQSLGPALGRGREGVLEDDAE